MHCKHPTSPRIDSTPCCSQQNSSIPYSDLQSPALPSPIIIVNTHEPTRTPPTHPSYPLKPSWSHPVADNLPSLLSMNTKIREAKKLSREGYFQEPPSKIAKATTPKIVIEIPSRQGNILRNENAAPEGISLNALLARQKRRL